MTEAPLRPGPWTEPDGSMDILSNLRCRKWVIAGGAQAESDNVPVLVGEVPDER